MSRSEKAPFRVAAALVFADTNILCVQHIFRRFAENFANLTTGMIFITFALSVSWICTSFFQIHSVSAYEADFVWLLFLSI